MGKKRKFELGDGGWWGEQPVAIVDWRQQEHTHGTQYRVVRVRNTAGSQWRAYGGPVWLRSYKLDVDPAGRRHPHVLRNYRAIQNLGAGADRGCSCHCCPHHAIDSKLINDDGSFVWED